MNRDGLLEVLRQLGADKVRVHETSGNIQVSCPLAPWLHSSGSDKNPSCSIKVADGDVSLFRCFSCGSQGTLVGLVSKVNRQRNGEFEELLKAVAKVERIDLVTQIERAAKKYEPVKPDVAADLRRLDFEVWSESEIQDWTGKVPRYALDRGVSLEVCREFELGFDKKGKRLVFPVRRAPDAALVGVLGRAIYEGMEPRYRDYWQFQKSRYMYAEHKVDPKLGKLIVVEGPMKVLKMWTFGHRNVVATMMAIPSAEQIRKIRNLNLDVYMMQDGDKAGRLARDMFVDRLHGRVRLFDVKLPDGGDPDEMAAEEVKAVLEGAELVM